MTKKRSNRWASLWQRAGPQKNWIRLPFTCAKKTKNTSAAAAAAVETCRREAKTRGVCVCASSFPLYRVMRVLAVCCVQLRLFTYLSIYLSKQSSPFIFRRRRLVRAVALPSDTTPHPLGKNNNNKQLHSKLLSDEAG